MLSEVRSAEAVLLGARSPDDRAGLAMGGWTDLVSLHPEQSRQMQVCVLLDLEQRLQSWEVTLKDCQLPVPTEEDIALVGQRDAHLALPPQSERNWTSILRKLLPSPGIAWRG